MKIIFWYLQLNRKMFCLYKITIWNEFSFALFWKYLVRISMICIDTTLNILFKATITNFLTYPHTIISELADIITTVEGQKPQEGCKKSAQQHNQLPFCYFYINSICTYTKMVVCTENKYQIGS